MAQEKFFRFGPIALTTTMTTNLLSPPSETGGVNVSSSSYYIVLDHISITNKTASPATFSLWLGTANTNAAGREVIGQGTSIAANRIFEWHGILIINPGEYLVGGASANTTLSITGQGRTGVTSNIDPLVQLPATMVAENTQVGVSLARVRLNNVTNEWDLTGNITQFPAATGIWKLVGSHSDYEARMTLNSGSITTGTLNVWLDLASVHSWTCQTGGGGPETISGNLTLEIRDKATTTVRATSSVTITANEIS
jgi:hypothetical protein